MKKTLEDELMGLAHRILRLRGREDVEQMKKLAGEVYEKLTILSFAEAHFAGPKPTIGYEDVEEALKEVEKDNRDVEDTVSVPIDLDIDLDSDLSDSQETEQTSTTEIEEPTPEETPVLSTEEDTSVEEPLEEEPIEEEILEVEHQEEVEMKEENPEESVLGKEEIIFEDVPKASTDLETEEVTQEYEVSLPDHLDLDIPKAMDEEDLPLDFPSEEIDLREIAVHYDDLPQFEPVPMEEEEVVEEVEEKSIVEEPEEEFTQMEETEEEMEEKTEPVEKAIPSAPLFDLFSGIDRPRTRNDLNPHKKSINESVKLGLNFGLNDRLAFINNLFEGNADDFNRVISQLNSFDNYDEARLFIEEQVKPDYNWENKSQFEERFYQALEHRLEA